MTDSTPPPAKPKRELITSPDYMARWLRGACSSGDPLHRALNLVLDDFKRRGDRIAELEQQLQMAVEGNRQLVVAAEAIGAKARGGEIPRFWEVS